MKQAKCHTCDKLTHNLLTPNCGHKICFNCVKINRNTHKCSYCSVSSSKNKLHSLSPARKFILDKERDRTTKTKSIESHRYQNRQVRRLQSSPIILKSSRKSQKHIQSCSNYGVQSSINQEMSTYVPVTLLCKQHHEPLALFNKTIKQAICSVCLCSKSKYRDEVMPIKGAQRFIRKQNHIQRQQSRIILNDVQKSYKTIRQNKDQFQRYYSTHVKIISEIFSNLHKELENKQNQIRITVDKLFLNKLKQCSEIQNDLTYLIETLRTYRQENKQNKNLSESLYVYSSFKVIKNTMKTLNLDYISYANRNINLLQYKKDTFDTMLANLLKFHQHLPLKMDEQINQSKKKNRSASSYQKVTRPENTYSRKKQSIYENLLNGKGHHHLLKQDEYQVKIKPQINKNHQFSIANDSSTVKQQNQLKPVSKSHNNSLSTYGQKQKYRQNQSTSTYFNKNSREKLGWDINGRKISERHGSDKKDIFDYELKTPIKNLISNKDGNSDFKEDSRISQSFEGGKSRTNDKFPVSNSSKKGQYNIISSANAISGLDLSEEQRSLYKRLLKSRFSKNPYHQQQEKLQKKPKQSVSGTHEQQQFYNKKDRPLNIEDLNNKQK